MAQHDRLKRTTDVGFVPVFCKDDERENKSAIDSPHSLFPLSLHLFCFTQSSHQDPCIKCNLKCTWSTQALEAALPPTVGELLEAAVALAGADPPHAFAARQVLLVASRCTVRPAPSEQSGPETFRPKVPAGIHVPNSVRSYGEISKLASPGQGMSRVMCRFFVRH